MELNLNEMVNLEILLEQCLEQVENGNAPGFLVYQRDRYQKILDKINNALENEEEY